MQQRDATTQETLACRKCAGTDIHVRWHEKTDKPWRPSPATCRDNSEHLHYVCRTCQFEWTGPTADE